MNAIFNRSSADTGAVQSPKNRFESRKHLSAFIDSFPDAGIPARRGRGSPLYRKFRASCRALVARGTDTYRASYCCFAEISLGRMEEKHIIAILSTNRVSKLLLFPKFSCPHAQPHNQRIMI